MTAQEAIIYKQLKSHPDEVAYITPDGGAVYALTDGGMLCITSELNLREMIDEDINKWICESLS